MSPLSHVFFLIFTSRRYHRDMKALKIVASNLLEFMIFLKMTNWFASADILNTTFSLKFLFQRTYGLDNSLDMLSDSGNSKITSKFSQNLLVLRYRKVLSKIIFQYKSVKQNDMALQLSSFLFLDYCFKYKLLAVKKRGLVLYLDFKNVKTFSKSKI